MRIHVLFRLLSLATIWVVLQLGCGQTPGVAVVGALGLLSFLFVWLPRLPQRPGRDRFLAVALFLLITSRWAQMTATVASAPVVSLQIAEQSARLRRQVNWRTTPTGAILSARYEVKHTW